MRHVWLVLVLLLIGCGGGSNLPQGPNATVRSQQVTAFAPGSVITVAPTTGPQTLGVGQPGMLDGGGIITLKGTEIPLRNPKYGSPGRDYIAADFEWCAGPHPAGGSASVSGLSFDLILADNTRTGPDMGNKDPSFASATLNPGECNRGWVTFSTPTGVKAAAIAYRTLRWPL